MIKKILFFPNWNGHLYLYNYNDKSVNLLYNYIKCKNKELINIKKNNITETNLLIETKLGENLKQNNFILSICGDHSNTYSLFKKFKEKYKDSKLIIFDAHPDVEISTDLVSHEDYLRNLIENKIVNPKDVYLLGIRTFSRIELEYLIKKKINFMTIKDIITDKEKVKNLLENIEENIYLSIDIDVLDPDFAPGTYYKEWCGLNIDELKEFINIIKKKVKASDICEYYSENDKNNITLNNIIELVSILIKK